MLVISRIKLYSKHLAYLNIEFVSWIDAYLPVIIKNVNKLNMWLTAPKGATPVN